MRLFRFDPEVGRRIDDYGSLNLTLSRIATPITGEVYVRCMHLGPGGQVGYHQAAVPQLFLVVQGHGWVRGEVDERHPVAAGRAAFWEAGEWHAAGTDQGMMAMVIEAEAFDPARFMPLG